ncbi:MAG TPA: ribosome-associated translation inhibitor RaiA [Acidimicrobiia bacterium]|nr:ribosome-associated translation inhibitor RaiA [Acidimicrobiia bacterium]
MEIVVRGKNRPVSKHLRAISREKVARIARFTHDAGRVEVDFSEVRNPREARPQECEVTVHLKRHFVKARACASEPETALDLVLDKVEQQVARIKDKRVTRMHPRRERAAPNGNGARTNGAASTDGTSANGHEPVDDAIDDLGDLDDADGAPEADHPRIVKTKRFSAKPMPPDEAALQMELLGHAFFLFANSETGRAAVLYRRNDGELGLIESTA